MQKYWSSDDALLTEPRDWRGKPGGMKLRLFALAELEESRRVQIEKIIEHHGGPLSVEQRALVTAGETRGRLLGSLIGVDLARFDRAPAAGEWSVRQTLGHIIATELVKASVDEERGI